MAFLFGTHVKVMGLQLCCVKVMPMTHLRHLRIVALKIDLRLIWLDTRCSDSANFASKSKISQEYYGWQIHVLTGITRVNLRIIALEARVVDKCK